jgi:hypothetical protein
VQHVPIRQLLRQSGWPGTPPTWCLAALVLLALSLVVPSAAGASGPSITPSIRGTAGLNGWYTSNVTVNWVIDPLPDSSSGCDAFTLSTDTAGTSRTCSATWGSTTIDYKLTIKLDKTAPNVTAAASRVPDSNGWYNHALSVSFSGTDGTSGVASCSSAASYSGPDSAGAAVYGTCRDNAGNTGSGALPLQYDATAPSIGGSAGRAPDANGWYNHALTVSFAGSDLTSGIASCSSPTYSGPDSSGASVSGTCRDKAGNTASATVGFKYDATAPVVSGTASRVPDSNGWYNHSLTVSFSGTDGTSGVASCSSAASYSGPDTLGAAVYGTCRDNAGNTGSGALPFQYDATAPSIGGSANRAPDANGWYNHALTVSFAGSDLTSGIASCSSPTYNGPDSAAAAVSGTCRDKAGNTATGTVGFKYDATAPAVSGRTSRVPDANGWYNHALSVSFSGTDGTSGVASCSSAASYSGPDSTDATVGGNCRDNAGNTGSGALTVQYDATPPAVRGAPGRPPDANGWFNHPVAVRFSGTDATSGVASCSSPSYSGPDSPSAALSGTCRDKAGNTASGAVGFKYDATPPSVRGAPIRPPDANGWYNHALTIAFSGSDAPSGIASCSSATYRGPDAAGATVSGNCRDRAGNSRSAAVSFKYDATPPTLRSLRVKHLDRSVLIRWRASADTRYAEVVRSPGVNGEQQTKVYSGTDAGFRDTHLRPGRKYRYTVTASDAAANAASKTMTVTATGPLLDPTPGEHVSSPPRLIWTSVKGAGYYNVQLLHRGRRVLSTWPRKASLQLTRRWTYKGRHYRFGAGLYQWYVWPGFGRLAQANYGRLLGGSSFVASG